MPREAPVVAYNGPPNSNARIPNGGLIAYGANFADLYRGAAGYVGRILKGEKTRRSACAGADEVRVADKSENRQGARSHRATNATDARRRGDRMMSAIGT